MLDDLAELAVRALDAPSKLLPPKKLSMPHKIIPDRGLQYTIRHRGVWFKPEYNFAEIQEAQDIDSYLSRAITKKVSRFMIAGHEFYGTNPITVKYIRRRVTEIAMTVNKPWDQLLRETVHDLVRYGNCIWVKVRDPEASSGRLRINFAGQTIKPIAGYFILPFETLEFKCKANGQLQAVKQCMPGGDEKEWSSSEVIHFYVNKKPGFSVGTPEMFPVLDDIRLLRRIEEDVEELIETNLFPVFHYTIGTDEMPQKVAPDGLRETDLAKAEVEYMPPRSMLITDHRHKINVLGSESHAMRIDFYLSYFKNRVFAGLGASAIDFGEGDTANRSTAGTMSKSMIQDVEALQNVVKSFLEFYVVNELMLEGSYDPNDEEDRVEIKFGVIDKEEQSKLENQTAQLVHGQLITLTEGRGRLGKRAYTEDDYMDTYFSKFEEPLALVKQLQPGSIAGQVLADIPYSNVEPEYLAHAEQYQVQLQSAGALGGPVGAPPTKTASAGAKKSSASQARPTNQHGVRTSPSFNADTVFDGIDWALIPDVLIQQFNRDLDQLELMVQNQVLDYGRSEQIVRSAIKYRFTNLAEQYRNTFKEALKNGSH